MLNPNPETVSTDYDTSDRLYLEPLTLERALDVCALEQPLGVVVSFGGQTPLRLAPGLADGRRAAARRPARRDRRGRGPGPLRGAARRARPARAGVARRRPTRDEARAVAGELGYPVLVRPHHVIGGRGIHVARNAGRARRRGPCLVDRFLDNAIELDVDVLCDGDDAWVAAILEHVERAGSPLRRLGRRRPRAVRDAGARAGDPRPPRAIARGLGARGLLNLQLALAGDELFVLEANPRASRTVPFVAKATGLPLVEHACRLLLGEPLADARPARTRGADARVGEGGGVPERPLRRRRRARPGDALDRRGNGERSDAGRGVRPRPSRCGGVTSRRTDRAAAAARVDLGSKRPRSSDRARAHSRRQPSSPCATWSAC